MKTSKVINRTIPAIIFSMIVIANTARSQYCSPNPVCYGEPINLYCASNGCDVPGATFLWSNLSGSWTSGEANPIIFPGTPGYATDMFYLVVEFFPPTGGFYEGTTIVNVLPQFYISGTTVNNKCFGSDAGAISITASGGGIPYSYQWSNGSVLRNQTGLSCGTYTVTVTDCFNCSNIASYEITGPMAPLEISSSVVTNVLCLGCQSGAINLSVNGGTAPYSYLWSNGENTEDISSLIPGIYTVTISDANDCPLSGSWMVSDAVEPICYGAPVYLLCNLSGCEVPGATYLWTNSSGSWTSEEANPVILPGTPGYQTDTFFLHVQFDPPPGGCSSGSYMISLRDSIGITPSQHDVQCYGASDGVISLAVPGNGGQYAYQWCNGNTTGSISGVAAGLYHVTVTDTYHCFVTKSWMVTQPPALAISGSLTPVSCTGGNDGSIGLVASGGLPPYSTAWNTGVTTMSIDNLEAGDYTVTITDQHYCFASETFTIPAGTTNCVTVLQGLEIENGLSTCFDAIQNLIIAGDGSSFVVGNGGSVDLVAGQKISLLPGALVFGGGFLHGYISLDGQFCNDLKTLQAKAVDEPGQRGCSPQEKPVEGFFRVYPNPTDGLFTLDLIKMEEPGPLQVEIYSMQGEMVLSRKFAASQKHTLSLADRASGIYLLRIFSKRQPLSVKIIKH
ncbi:MAG: T9SS type A sorting domain-containing protein [Bacteroidetes bacterium]|nr:T9SS type A sorting domain-containing protein [Bacteroidota bacterium]